MHARLDYYTTTNINLSLEDYHNAGIPREVTKGIIEGVREQGTGYPMPLRCRPSGINSNWTITLMTSDDFLIESTVREIKYALDMALLQHKMENGEQQ